MRKPTYQHLRLCLMALSAMIALFSAGCSQSEEPDGGNRYPDEDGIVAFGAYVSNSSPTRASVSNIHTLKKDGFGVFASITGKEEFQDNPASGGFSPDYMYNQKVVWQGLSESDSTWVYEPELLWPGAQKVSFFAYSPYTDKPNAAITGWSGINDSGSPKIIFSLSKVISKQVDLLYANALNLSNSPVVPMNFKHALSRISIQYSSASSADPNTTISIKKLTFKSTDLGTGGVLNLGTGLWSNISGTTEHIFAESDTQAMKKGFMVIPPGNVASMEIAVEYSLTTKDKNLSTGSFKIEDRTSKSFSIFLEGGKVYSLNLQIKLNAIEINATVKDWPDDDHTWESDQSHDNKLETDEQQS